MQISKYSVIHLQIVQLSQIVLFSNFTPLFPSIYWLQRVGILLWYCCKILIRHRQEEEMFEGDNSWAVIYFQHREPEMSPLGQRIHDWKKNKHETIRVAVIKRCIPRGFFRVASCVINSKTRLFVEIKATLGSYMVFFVWVKSKQTADLAKSDLWLPTLQQLIVWS